MFLLRYQSTGIIKAVRHRAATEHLYITSLAVIFIKVFEKLRITLAVRAI